MLTISKVYFVIMSFPFQFLDICTNYVKDPIFFHIEISLKMPTRQCLRAVLDHVAIFEQTTSYGG